MARPTKRGVGLVLGAIVLFMIGTNIQSGWLFVLGSLLLGAVIAGLLLPRRMVRAVRVERRAPSEAHAGDDVAVDLVVSNPTRRTLLSLTVRDPHIAPFRAFVPWLLPHETKIVGTVRRSARRGIVDGAPVEVSTEAPLGIGRTRRTLDAPGRTVILPRIVPVPSLPDLASASKPLHAAVVQARKGSGQDYLGIREYQLGDSLRHIHWPSTARHGGLMVREFEQELPRRLGIVVDTWADTDDEETVLDRCCAVAASFAVRALAEGQPVTMTAASDGRPEGWVGLDPVEGLTWLAGLRSPGGSPFPEAVAASTAILGRIDTLLLAFPTWKANSAPAVIEALRGYLNVQIAAAPVEVHAANRLAMSADERSALVAGLAANAITVSPLDVELLPEGTS